MCKCILFVCLLGAAAAARAGGGKKDLVMVEIEPITSKDSSSAGNIEKRQTYRQEAQATYGAAPGQYLVRTGQQPDPQQHLLQQQQLQQQQLQLQQQQQQQEIPEEYLAALQQLAIQQQQQEEVQRQQLQQPHIQQLIVSRDPQAHAARFSSTPKQVQAQLVSQDSRYSQQPQPQPQPQRPATRRPPTEQQVLQQTFFESTQLQGQLRAIQAQQQQPQPQQLPASQAHSLHQQRLQASLSGADPSYAAAQQQQRYAEQQQIAALQAQAQTFYSQAPQAFPQPSQQPPARHRVQVQPKPAYPTPPEQYLRETSPPVQQQPLIVSLNREQIQVQASPDQSVYYTSSQQQQQQQPSPSQRPVEYQTASPAELGAYLRQQHLQQASPSASPSPYYRPQQLQQQQPSPSPQAYAQQPSTSPDPSAYLRQQIPTVDPLVYQQVQQAVTPATPTYRPVGYPSPSPTPQYVSPSPGSYRRPQPQYAQHQQAQQQRPPQTYYTRQRALEEQSEEPNQEAISSILSQYPGRSPYESPERNAKALPNPSPSRSSIFVTTASSKNPDTEDDDSSNALPVVRLPTPQGQRALTQREYQALLAAGFDISPVEGGHAGQQQSPTEAVYYETSPKYQRSYVTASPPVNNQLAQPRRKPQQEAEPQYTYEQVVLEEPQHTLVARRPGGPRRQQLRHPSRSRDEYPSVQAVADSPQEQETYLAYDNAPASSKRREQGVTRLAFLRREREE